MFAVCHGQMSNIFKHHDVNDEISFLILLLDRNLGSYGTVYKGQHIHTGKYVAMKRIHTDLSENGFPQTYLR